MGKSASRTRYTNRSSGNDFMKRNVYSCLLREAREVAVVTLVGRLFPAVKYSQCKNATRVVCMAWWCALPCGKKVCV